MRKRSRSVNGHSSGHLTTFLRELELDFKEHVQFLHAFLKEPAIVGALSPSSRALARAMIQGFSLKTADTVVELGPGTGAFTGPIRERLGKHTTFITMELDPTYAQGLRRRFPGLIVYNDSAERMGEYLAAHGKQYADYIVCGLPWANLSPLCQTRIIEAITRCLAPSGVFTTFAYVHARWLPKARRFRHQLQTRFARVETSSVVWRNLPPAFVYRCTGQSSGALTADATPGSE